MTTPGSIFDIEAELISGERISLADYRGKVLLIVNTASKCGFTPQYADLQKLYDRYKEQGLEILAFPSNQFLSQEPGSNKKIEEFCNLTFNISFPLFSKIEVNGKNTHPLFRYLKNEKRGLFGLKFIKWNFTKFIVDRNGDVIRRFAPIVKPAAIEKTLVSLL